MNERIKELALQARAQYCDLGDASCFKRLGLVEAVVFTPEDLEKFAELIVRECIDIAKNWEDQLENADSLKESNAVGIVAYRIARQFGVKE